MNFKKKVEIIVRVIMSNLLQAMGSACLGAVELYATYADQLDDRGAAEKALRQLVDSQREVRELRTKLNVANKEIDALKLYCGGTILSIFFYLIFFR